MSLEKRFKVIINITLILFIILLVWIIYFKMGDTEMIYLNHSWLKKLSIKDRFLYDLVPFKLRYDITRQFIEVLLNAVVFAPFGVILSLRSEKIQVIRHSLFCFLLSLGFELIQLFTTIGSFATADLIMNTMGYFIGLLIYQIFFKKASTKFNIIFFTIINVLMIVILIYGISVIISKWEVYSIILQDFFRR